MGGTRWLTVAGGKMTPDLLETAIRDAQYELADTLPPRVFGFMDLDERQEWEDTAWLAEMLADDDRGPTPPEARLSEWLLEEAPRLRERLLAKAYSGSRISHDALCYAAERLTAINKPLPAWLQRYVVVAAREGRKHPKRGRPSDENSKRDGAIMWTALVVTLRYNLRPTRNVASTTASACSVVETALKRLSIVMTEANVNKIWLSGDGPRLLAAERDLARSLGPDLSILKRPFKWCSSTVPGRLECWEPYPGCYHREEGYCYRSRPECGSSSACPVSSAKPKAHVASLEMAANFVLKSE